jgi:hypothetical protein
MGQRGYWMASSGSVTDEVWMKYIEDQKPNEPDDHFKVVLGLSIRLSAVTGGQLPLGGGRSQKSPRLKFPTGLQWSAIAAPVIAAPIMAVPIIATPIIAAPVVATPIIAGPIIAISTVEREHAGELNMLNRQAGRRRRQEAVHRCGLGEVGAANDRAISGAGRKDNYP